MKKIALFIGSLVFLITSGLAQKNITLEDVWSKGTFSGKAAPGFNFMKDGRHYTLQEENKIQQYDLTTGKLVQTILDAATLANADGFAGKMQDYAFSADEQQVLIMSDLEPLYRHSYKGNYFIYNRQAKTLKPLFEQGKISLAFFNPQGTKVAFVFENNLYIKDLASEKITQVTNDGALNKIINGGMDWVYEEEFALTQGYHWSPDGQRLAFYRFDESAVKEFTMTMYYNALYPEYQTFKYPKVGEKNSIVTIHIYDVNAGKTVQAQTGSETDIYIPRIRWMTNEQLCVFRMNRHQNQLELLQTDVNTGATKVIFNEKNKYYIEEATLDDVTFLAEGKSFLFTSERDGWRHLYLAAVDGGKTQQLTKGAWEVSNVYGVDEKNKMVYYQAAEKSPLERQVFALTLDGKVKRALANDKGWNNATFSSTFDYYVLNHSTMNTPATYAVYDRNGKEIRVIENNKALATRMTEYKLSPAEFFKFKTSENVELNGWMIKPSDFNANRKYPVLMFVYGGPGSQQVVDRFSGGNFWWYQMLAQQGFVVACVDNRGTGGRGEEFKKVTYLQLGKYETIDQIEAAKYLGNQPFVDKNNIGIFGWSYGGYMSSLCILKGSDVFKAAIAVAPVTNWKWYDSIYTERYMQTESENPTGYRDNSPVNFADRLKGNYLLVHGMGDDNVHFQHTAEMANALIKANKQFDTYFYPNRNHGISGGTTRLHLYTKMTNFLQEHLVVQNNNTPAEKPATGVKPKKMPTSIEGIKE
ncbi:MAG: S9 family peptidase [Saprospiraceae bacterium]